MPTGEQTWLSDEFKRVVHALDRTCIVEPTGFGGTCEGVLQAHHVITQAQLRACGLFGLRWDPANGAVVCERHHRRHHNRREPIALAALPNRCREFADKHGLTDLLNRYYWAAP